MVNNRPWSNRANRHKHKRHRLQWQQKELQFIIDNYEKCTVVWIAEQLGRSYDAVTSQVRLLRCEGYKVYNKAKGRRRPVF